VFRKDFLKNIGWILFWLCANGHMLEKNSSCANFHYVSLIDEIMHLISCTWLVSDYFTTHDLKGINYKSLVIVSVFRLF